VSVSGRVTKETPGGGGVGGLGGGEWPGGGGISTGIPFHRTINHYTINPGYFVYCNCTPRLVK
jgi:hypothetical protein